MSVRSATAQKRDETAAAFRANEQTWNAEVIAEFRANGGEVTAPYDDPPPMLLIHTIGARSGKEHTVPMRGLPHGESLYIFASAHGSDRHPDWYCNLVANPDISIEKGTATIPVRAAEVRGAERDAVFARYKARFPIFADYERRLNRIIPVIRLDGCVSEGGAAVSKRHAAKRRHRMYDELLASVAREVLAWPGVEKESGTFGQFGLTIFKVGKRQLGHIHHDGVADLQFPRAIHDRLIAEGRAQPHRGGFAAVVSYVIRQPADVAGAVELFRMSYDRETVTSRP